MEAAVINQSAKYCFPMLATITSTRESIYFFPVSFCISECAWELACVYVSALHHACVCVCGDNSNDTHCCLVINSQ